LVFALLAFHHDVAKLISFEEGVKTGTADIAPDEHTSINAAPRELQEEYELAQVSGDKERIEEVLTVLWEDYGIHGENPPVREASELSVLQSCTMMA
jgi:hypothetical protein